MTVRLMSDGELSRLEVLRDLDQKRLTTAAAAQLLGLERRQVFRLLKAYRADGAAGLISKRRGRRSRLRRAMPNPTLPRVQIVLSTESCHGWISTGASWKRRPIGAIRYWSG